MKLKTIITLILLTLGLWHVSASGYMLSKAWLSQYLIKAAWEQTLIDKQWHKPWSWADTYPVATLKVPRLNASSYVLAGTSGRNLAFSVTHLSNSGMPGQQKTVVLSGHKDSHFDYLQHIQIGDKILFKTIDKTTHYYVQRTVVIDSRQQKLKIRNKDELLLTTCYPFGGLTAGSSLRYMVYAVPARQQLIRDG